MFKTYKVLAAGWLTDAHGVAKQRNVGDSVELADDQAYWLKKARTIETAGSAPKPAAADPEPPPSESPVPPPIKRK